MDNELTASQGRRVQTEHDLGSSTHVEDTKRRDDYPTSKREKKPKNQEEIANKEHRAMISNTEKIGGKYLGEERRVRKKIEGEKRRNKELRDEKIPPVTEATKR